jgi:hypothetical protein
MPHMEWMLLVVDDLDDLVGSIGHCLYSIRRELATAAFILASVAVLVAVTAIGVTPILLSGLALMLSVGIALRLRQGLQRGAD